jgi:uncharacterized repeat protein (TIGR01451 family)
MTDDFFGYSVAISGDTVVVGAYGEDSNAIGVDGDQADNSTSSSGAAYVFVRNGTSWSQQAYLKASNTWATDHFGWSVAISGDTVVVGAFFEDSSATGVDGNQADNSAANSGAAYVFVRSGSTWSQQAYLKASNTDAGDQFGYSVAVSGDTVLVGAFGERSNATGVDGNQADNSGPFSGAAYVFVRSGSTWSQQAYLKASNADPGDQFGYSVALSADTAVVGAIGEGSAATGVDSNQADDSAGGSGAAYVFVRSGSTWSQQAYLKASNTDPGDQFGYSVAVSGDTVVVGAPVEASNATGVDGDQADNSAAYYGASYVFVRSATSWSQQAYLKASNADAGDSFGQIVAISGDTVAVGAYDEDSAATGIGGNQADNSASQSGAVYAFVRNGTTWTQQAYIKASNVDAHDFFGDGVAISGDTIVVGADGEDSNATGINGSQADNSATDSGAVYVFQLPSADLSITKTDGVPTATPGGSLTYTITAANAGPSNALGATVADTFPAALTCTWTCVGAGGGTCTANGSGNISDSVNLPAGGSVTYTASCTVSPSASGTISNTATVDAPAGVTDPTPGNNSATDEDVVLVPAQVSATKTASPGPYFVGDAIAYTIVLSNAGPGPQGDNPGDELIDVLPASLALVSATATSGTAFANLGTNTVTWNGAIPGAGSVTVTINATILPTAAGTTVTNQGTVSFDGDGNGSNEATAPSDDPGAGGADDATAIAVTAQSVVEIPTLDRVGLVTLLLGIAGLTLARLRRARRA